MRFLVDGWECGSEVWVGVRGGEMTLMELNIELIVTVPGTEHRLSYVW